MSEWTKIEHVGKWPVPETLPPDRVVVQIWRSVGDRGVDLIGESRLVEIDGHQSGCLNGGLVTQHETWPDWSPGEGDWWRIHEEDEHGSE